MVNFTYTRRTLWILTITLGTTVFAAYIHYNAPNWLWATTIVWACTIGIWATLHNEAKHDD